MTISDRLKDAPHYATIPDTNAGPKCEPWNAQAEIAALKAKLADHSSTLVDLIAAQAKRIAKLEAAPPTTHGLVARHEHILDEFDRLKVKVNKANEAISDLADRLSVVHVQAQGDARLRTLAQNKIEEVLGRTIDEHMNTEPVRSAFFPETQPIPPDSVWQPEDGQQQNADPCSDDRERRLYHIVVDPDGKWRKERVVLRRGDEIILAYPNHPVPRDNDIISFDDLDLGGFVLQWDGTAGTAWDMHIRAKNAKKSPARALIDKMIAKEEAKKNPNEKAIDKAINDAILHGAGHLKITAVSPADMMIANEEQEDDLPDYVYQTFERMRGKQQAAIAERKARLDELEKLQQKFSCLKGFRTLDDLSGRKLMIDYNIIAAHLADRRREIEEGKP
jgi:hypothetical protein